MKKKLLTFLLAIFMVIPVVGCGEPDLSGNPESDQTKILLNFAEQGAEENTYVTKESELTNYYSDCATLYGAGFYDIGDYASISLSFNNTACSFKGWIRVEGENVLVVHSSSDPFGYEVKDSDAGKTIIFYAVMGPKDGSGGGLNSSTTQLQLKAFFLTQNTFSSSFQLTDDGNGAKVVELPSGTFKYEETKFVNVDDATQEFLIDGQYVLIKGAIYTIIKDSLGAVTGLAAGSSTSTNPIPDDSLDDYYFVTTSGSSKSFENIKSIIETRTDLVQGSKLSDLDPAVNFSYYTNSHSELQYYKIIWKYKIGKCTNDVVPDTIFNPTLDALPTNPYICLSANIDLTQGLTESFIKDAVTATFYNRAYVDTVSNSTCMTVNKGEATVNDTCMFIQNIGALTDVIPNEDTRISKTTTLYYALNKDSQGKNRIEGIIPSASDLVYNTYTYDTAETKALKSRYISRDRAALTEYNLKIKDVYGALLDALASPQLWASRVTFEYDDNAKIAVISSIVVPTSGGNVTYYFNYVEGVNTTHDYYPRSITQGEIVHTLNRESMDVNKFSLVLDDSNASDTDVATFNKLITKVKLNPQNLMGDNVSNKINSLVYELINSEAEFADLKKYEVSISINGSTLKATIKFTNRSFDPSALKLFKFGYDSYVDGTENLFLMKFDTTNPNIFDTSAYTRDVSKLLEYVNLFLSDDLLKAQDTWVQVKTAALSTYNEYSFYQSAAGHQLVYRFRYYASNNKFVVMHTQYDGLELFSFRLVNEIGLKDYGSSTVLELAGGPYELLTKTIYTIKSDDVDVNTYEGYLEAIGDTYIFDFKNKAVYNKDDNILYPLNLNLADELKYYFVIDESYYYGVYYKNEKFSVYSITLPDDVTHTKGEKLADLEKIDYIKLDDSYYPLINENGTDYVELGGTKHALTFGVLQTEVEIVIEGIIVKRDGSIIDEPGKTIVETIYELILDNMDSTYEVRTANLRYVIIHEGELYELVYDSNTGAYNFEYDSITYVIKFS